MCVSICHLHYVLQYQNTHANLEQSKTGVKYSDVHPSAIVLKQITIRPIITIIHPHKSDVDKNHPNRGYQTNEPVEAAAAPLAFCELREFDADAGEAWGFAASGAVITQHMLR